ncbi:hypothetical protein ABF179_001116 [Flavobacterium psychrophilum]|uniref:hypothetical protein n=1 Tax=Flavobacterium psychrophilum TaxID=96345 RepID=UPI000B7C4EAE|nr:hypothetical protein [Flavobacterium psychrophilum]ELM3644426.1 hypothetical protein [Flavobacterium psychrophilum]MBF2092900.1 hypothetical protein [Flavobacterium psychrophilum]SNA66030.1 conserved hypothetical protein [Flavobacterium psychrophilum]SNB39063.1 conserved hypothetical protein [Flavobacterium psychrophilum]
MNKLETKILKAIQTNKLNSEILGKTKWYNYFIRVTELVWSINLYDGYLIEAYTKNTVII